MIIVRKLGYRQGNINPLNELNEKAGHCDECPAFF
jgi:hypothetical protein